MRYGINLPNGGLTGNPHAAAELAALAEVSGWDGVFLEDYIVWQGHQEVPTYDPWILLAAMAVQTTRVRLGITVTPLSRRRPWKVARESVTLDHLSNGRMILGAGLGDTRLDISLTHFGEVIDVKQRSEMLDEALEIMAKAWSGQPFSYSGKHYQIKEVALLPKPVQMPRIPIWIGGGFPLQGATQRALRWDGSCMYLDTRGGPWRDWAPDDVRTLRTMAQRQRGPVAPFDIVLGGRQRGANWEQERALINSLAQAGATWWIEYLPPELGALDVIRKAIARGPLRID